MGPRVLRSVLLRANQLRALRKQGSLGCAFAFEPASWESATGPAFKTSEQAIASCSRSTAGQRKGGGLQQGQLEAQWSQVLALRHFSAHSATSDTKTGLLQIPLAQTGEGIAECEVIQYFVIEGQEVDAFQPVCEVQSDKATVEITSRYKGTVNRLYFEKGDIAKVGDTLLDLIPEGGLPQEAETPAEASDHAELEPHRGEAAAGKTGRSKPLATPSVRALAKEEGVDLSAVVGTGKDGRIIAEDIQRHVSINEGVAETRQAAEEAPQKPIEFHPPTTEAPQTSKPTHTATVEEDTIVPIRGYRRAMVKSMTAAGQVPHFMCGEEIEMDALMALRGQLKDDPVLGSLKLTYLPFLLKALSQALKSFPQMNSVLSQDHTQLVHKAAHNIGVAMATPNGLVVPNVKNCQRLSVVQIAEELARLTALARSSQLLEEDLRGGTITLSNVGTIGGTYATPLVNVPEVAIVAIGRIQRLPRYDHTGAIRPVAVMNASWAADHRVVDGATLAGFCKEWKSSIELPARLLLHLT